MTKYHLRPYKDFASEYAAERNGKELEFLSFPTPGQCVFLVLRYDYFEAGNLSSVLVINQNFAHKRIFPSFTDGFIRMDTEVVEFIQRLFGRLKLHPVSCLYLHCRHGRGRTGTIAALLLVQYYSMDPTQALSLTGLYHSQRVNSRGKSPQTRAQCSQVVRLAPVLTPPADKS